MAAAVHTRPSPIGNKMGARNRKLYNPASQIMAPMRIMKKFGSL